MHQHRLRRGDKCDAVAAAAVIRRCGVDGQPVFNLAVTAQQPASFERLPAGGAHEGHRFICSKRWRHVRVLESYSFSTSTFRRFRAYELIQMMALGSLKVSEWQNFANTTQRKVLVHRCKNSDCNMSVYMLNGPSWRGWRECILNPYRAKCSKVLSTVRFHDPQKPTTWVWTTALQSDCM